MTSELSNFAARLRGFIQSAFGDGAFHVLALDLFRLQFTHNAPYRRFCEVRGVTPSSITDWREIPTIPTLAFKELELSCLPATERTTVFHSSGTTEQKPSRHFHSAESLAIYEASLLAWFERHVLGDLRFTICGLLAAILTPPPSQALHSSLVHMLDTVRCELGAAESAFVGRIDGDGAWTLDFATVLAMLRDSCAKATPVLLLGTAFSFVHLLDFLAENNLRFELPPGSRVMETGGYKGRSRSLPKTELHALITRRLGIPASHIVCEYGMSELSSQAYDKTVQSEDLVRPHPDPLPGGEGQGEGGSVVRFQQAATRQFCFPPWTRAQIISPETGREVGEGETGLIRVFDLANVFSVMAIQTEDLGVRRGEGFELVGRAALAEPRGCSLMAV